MPAIECVEFREHEKGALIGFATIWVEKMGLEIDGFSLYQKDGRRWVNMPSREYKDKDTGEAKYKSTIRMRNKEHYNMFLEGVRDAIDLYRASKATESVHNDEPLEPAPF